MTKTEHTHKYKRVILGGKRIVRDENGKRRLEPKDGYMIFKCVLPGCPHHVPRELVEGRKSVCWRCGGELVMSPRNLTQARPVHRECVRKKQEAA